MPYISRLNEQTFETFTCYLDDPTGFYVVNTDDGGYVPYHQVKEYTDVFYNDLKILLDDAAANGLDVECNEIEKSFTLFGQKFYCFCIEVQYTASSTRVEERYSVVPILYKENYVSNPEVNIYEGGATSAGNYSGTSANSVNSSANANVTNGYALDGAVPGSSIYHTNQFVRTFNRHFHDYHLNYTVTAASGTNTNAYYTSYSAASGVTGYGEIYNFMGFNLPASLCENYTLRHTVKYKINMHYNDNYLDITYSTLHDGYIHEYPLGFFIKGTDCLNNEVLLTTLSPTILGANSGLADAYGENITSMFTRVTIWDIKTGRHLYEQDMEPMRTFNIDKYPFVNEYTGIDNTQFAKIALQALNGLIIFDNAIVGEISEKYHTFTRGQYYTIDGEDYYVPEDYGVDVMHPDKATYNGIFLKM